VGKTNRTRNHLTMDTQREIEFSKHLVEQVRETFDSNELKTRSFFICSYEKEDTGEISLVTSGKRRLANDMIKKLYVGLAKEDIVEQYKKLSHIVEHISKAKAALHTAPEELFLDDVVLDIGLNLGRAKELLIEALSDLEMVDSVKQTTVEKI
jgi:hypothetical protein